MKDGQSFLGWLQMDGRYVFRDIYYGIKNLIKWFPLVWKDADWDYYYIMKTLRFKINNTANYIEKHNRYEGYERDIEKMRLCVRLMDALDSDVYELEYQDYYETIFNFEKEKPTSNPTIDNLDQYLAKYPNYVRRLGIIPVTGNNLSASFLIGAERHKRATRLLFTLIERNIYKWWD